MASKRGRPTRYLTKTEFKILKALFKRGIPKVDALTSINMTLPTFNARIREAHTDSDAPKKELSPAQKTNIKYIFELLKTQAEHAQTLVRRLNLDEGRNVRWLLATLYPNQYSQRVAEDRVMKDDIIRDYDEPSEAQQQASELLSEGDTPDVPGLDD